jgi:hypothetical protein
VKLKKNINNEKINASISHLYYIIKYKLKLTHKQIRTKYYPLKKLPTLKKDKYEYYKELKKVGIDTSDICYTDCHIYKIIDSKLLLYYLKLYQKIII